MVVVMVVAPAPKPASTSITFMVPPFFFLCDTIVALLLGACTKIAVGTKLYCTGTSQPQRFHTDSTDVVGLLCLTNEADGGLSSIASSVSVHQRMQELHPKHCDVLEGA